MRIFNYLGFFLLACISIIVVSGCSNQLYQTKQVTPPTAFPKAIQRAAKDKRYFIMQSGINYYTVTSVDVNQEKQHFTVTLDKVDSMRLVYFKNPSMPRTNMTYPAGVSKQEIHMLMTDSTSYTMDEPHTIPFTKIGQIELLD